MEDDRLDSTIADFDGQNACDPRARMVRGVAHPQELIDAARLGVWVSRLVPDPSVALRLAAHCQHLRRWEVPRDSYPNDRAGYLKWRSALKRIHADRAAETLRAHGWPEATIDAVRDILQKHPGKDAAHMEDALCLTFLEHELEAFADKHPDDKIVHILQKTWRKMSGPAREAALAIPFPPRLATLISRALAGDTPDAT